MEMSRRGVVATMIAAGAASIAEELPSGQDERQALTADQEFVMAAGLTQDEAECWKKAAAAAAAFFKLEPLHPMDRGEVASAIHILQNKLLARPTYRKYLAKAKAGAGDDKDR